MQKYSNDIRIYRIRLGQLNEEMSLAIGIHEKGIFTLKTEIIKELDSIMAGVLLVQGKGNAVLKLLNKKLSIAKKEESVRIFIY